MSVMRSADNVTRGSLSVLRRTRRTPLGYLFRPDEPALGQPSPNCPTVPTLGRAAGIAEKDRMP